MPVPWDYVRARVCERFGCLPSALDEEDAEVYRLYSLLTLAERLLEQKREMEQRAR